MYTISGHQKNAKPTITGSGVGMNLDPYLKLQQQKFQSRTTHLNSKKENNQTLKRKQRNNSSLLGRLALTLQIRY